MCIDIDLHRRVHANDSKATNDFWGIGNLLRTQQDLARIPLPAIVEAFEAIWRETNGCCSSEVQMATVKQVQERIFTVSSG